MQSLLPNNYYSGLFAECIAKVYFFFTGYEILKSRYKTGKGFGAGEIDLILQKKHQLVFVEVKKRNNFLIAVDAITQKQLSRTENSINVFLSQNQKYKNYDIRFDIVIFNQFYLFKHFKNCEI